MDDLTMFYSVTKLRIMYTKNIALPSRTTSLLEKWAQWFENFEEIKQNKYLGSYQCALLSKCVNYIKLWPE